MPLPTSGSFTVMGYSRPGEAEQSKPKQAMIVRMSPEALDALQDFPNHPPMEFQFGDTPGIYIGATFFPLNPSPEGTPHDLYLRASSATKKTPPFKLHANVIGKFSVQRDFVPSVGEKIRESTTEAMAQRENRKAILFDDPQLSSSKSGTQTKQKKKKDTTAASSSRTTSLVDKTKSKALASASRVAKNPVSTSNPLDKLSPETVQNLRRRLIHFLAPEERSEDDVVRAVGGANCTPQFRQAVCQVLEDVGESKSSSKQYRLKQRSWLEVRPYEWNKWSDAVRTRVCRDARMILKALGKSESDPIWNHFTFRKSISNNGLPVSTSSSSTASNSKAPSGGGRDTPEPKRGIMSRDHREKMAATNKSSNRKSEIMMKDESRSASRNQRDESPGDVSRAASSSSSSANATRKQPGSGFKSTTTSKLSGTADAPSKKLNDMRPPGRDSPSVSSSQNNTPQGSRAQRLKALGDESTHESENERRRPNQPSQSSKLAQRSKAEGYQDSDNERRRQQRPIERERERERDRDNRDRERERDRDRDRDTKDRGKDRGRERDRDRERHSRVNDLKREREDGETSDASTNFSKRKPRSRDDDDDDFQPARAAPKRRKIEPLPPSLPPKPKLLGDDIRSHHRRASDLDPQFYHKSIKREPSPLNPMPANKRPRSPPPPKRAPIPTPGATSNIPSASNHASGSKGVKLKPALKFRRGSSIYTSSEDEGELPQSNRPRAQPPAPPAPPPKSTFLPPPPPLPSHTPLPSSLPTPSQTSSSSSTGATTGRVPSSLRSSRPSSKPYGTDRPSLRVRYSKTYADYTNSMHKLSLQRVKLESMLRDHDHLSGGSITDSEGDELLATEELALLAAQNKLQHEELNSIKKQFDMMDSSGTGGSSE